MEEKNNTELIFRNSASKLTREEIHDFEVRYNLHLPEEYIRFLLSHNGGSPDKVYFIENGADLVVNTFWSLSKEKYNLERYYTEMVIQDKELPEKILPIGDDAFGNAICLSCRDEDFGKVYFWDHEEDWDHDDCHDVDLRLLAENISIILDNLVEDFD